MNRQEQNINFFKQKHPEHEYNEEVDLKILLFINQVEQPCMYIWKGRQKDPFVRYYYRSIEERAEVMGKYISRALEIHKSKIERRELRKTLLPNINVTDIYRASWGYDQTQVDYYQIVEKVSDHFALIQPICSETVPGSEGMDCCSVVPKRNAFVEGTEPFRAKITCLPKSEGTKQYQYIKIDSVRTAFPDEGKPSHRSWYR